MALIFQNKELISRAGFFHYETCNCGNILTYKFKKPKRAKEIWVMPDRKEFRFLVASRIFRTGSLNDLKTKMIDEFATKP